jgi:hypothetical protein
MIQKKGEGTFCEPLTLGRSRFGWGKRFRPTGTCALVSVDIFPSGFHSSVIGAEERPSTALRERWIDDR